jgi:hypothetical protein
MTLMVVSIAVIVVVVFGGSIGCGGGRGVGCDHVGEIRFTCKAPWS